MCTRSSAQILGVLDDGCLCAHIMIRFILSYIRLECKVCTIIPRPRRSGAAAHVRRSARLRGPRDLVYPVETSCYNARRDTEVLCVSFPRKVAVLISVPAFQRQMMCNRSLRCSAALFVDNRC